MIPTPEALVLAAGALAISFALIYPFALWLKPRAWHLVVGGGVVAFAAYYLEGVVQSWTGREFGPVLIALVVAPAAEEILKLGACAGILRATRSQLALAVAAAVGLGFAAFENANYYLADLGAAAATFWALVAVRTVSDPVLHATATSISVQSLQGRIWALPAAIGIHAGWNYLALELLDAQLNGTASVAEVAALLLAVAFALLGLLVAVRRHDWSDHAPAELGAQHPLEEASTE